MNIHLCPIFFATSYARTASYGYLHSFLFTNSLAFRMLFSVITSFRNLLQKIRDLKWSQMIITDTTNPKATTLISLCFEWTFGSFLLNNLTNLCYLEKLVTKWLSEINFGWSDVKFCLSSKTFTTYVNHRISILRTQPNFIYCELGVKCTHDRMFE